MRLPVPSTALVGREVEITTARELLSQQTEDRPRLLTLVGPGGVGKTRLAQAIAAAVEANFEHGVAFVDLAPVRDPRLVPAAIGRVLTLRESASREARDVLIDHLRDKDALLVLDSFEHLSGAVSLLVDVLDACPRMVLLVTSRTVLRLRAERRFQVEPLTEAAAVRLFIERARTINPRFGLLPDDAPVVLAVCRRLEGIPLAIELAASRSDLLTPQALLRRLDHRLALLTRGGADAPLRHQTLRNTLAWSYDLLTPAEQVLFRRLAVFGGGWTLDAAVTVCRVSGDADGPDNIGVLEALGSLVDKSLVKVSAERSHDDEPRFAMLDTIREYASVLLVDSPEAAEVRRRHAEFFVALAETAEPELAGPDQGRWLTRLGAEHDNLRIALKWAVEVDHVDFGLRLAGAIWRFWWVLGYLAEGRQWLDELLSRPSADTPTAARVRARALNGAASLAFGQGDYRRARALYEESLAAGRRGGDPDRVVTALHNLGFLAAEQGETVQAAAFLEECLAEARGASPDDLLGVALTTLGDVARQQGEFARATRLLDEALVHLHDKGNLLWEGAALIQQGNVARDAGEIAHAAERYTQALDVCRTLGDGYTLGTARCLEGLASVASASREAVRAAQLFGAAAAIRETISAPLAPSSRVACVRDENVLRSTLGDDQFLVERAAGRRLSVAEAVALALNPGLMPTAPSGTAVEPSPLPNIRPPLVRVRLVPRQRLVDKLDGVLTHRVVLLAAPAGFGKTTILVDWEAHIRSRMAIAWVSLAAADDDPVRFWRLVMTALQAQHPSVARQALHRLESRAPIELVVDDLLRELLVLDSHLALVLDDYHVVHAPAVHASLARLLDGCPAHFHLVLSTRSDPPLPLGRLRSNGQLVELRAADLQFEESEARALLVGVMGLELSAEQVAALKARTEGWAAGLQLAALSLRDREDVNSAIAEFAGSGRVLIDYFVEEVLVRLPQRTRDFLERTSILDRLHGSLCDAVLDVQGSATMLEALERDNVFVTPLELGHDWFRYHQLFADALRHRLRRDTPELVSELQRRASDWYAARGLVAEAIEYALAAQRWDRAADLIGPLIVEMLRRGEHTTLQRWLACVPGEVSRQHPVLSGQRALMFLLAGEFDALDVFAHAAETALEAVGEREALARVLSFHAQMAAVREQTDVARARAQRALALLPPGPSGHRAAALSAIIRTYLSDGDLSLAAPVLDQALDATGPISGTLVAWDLRNLDASRSRLAGLPHRAQTRYAGVLDDIGERAVFARDVALIGLGVIAYEWNRLDEADDDLDRLGAMRRLAGRSVQLPFPALLRAQILRARERFGPAGDAVDSAEQAARNVSSVRLRRRAQAERAWLALADGRLGTAVRWADELDQDGLDGFQREPEALILARVRRAQGAGSSLEQLLGRMLAAAEHHGRVNSVVAILAQLALVRSARGDELGGLTALERALLFAVPAGYVRVFLDDGAPMLALLRRLLKHETCAAYVARLVWAFGNSAADAPAQSVELLTPRERDVLRLVAVGLSNRAIAERLVTSEATIKSHVHRLIGKLGVTNRGQVVVRAREIGALDALTGRGAAG